MILSLLYMISTRAFLARVVARAFALQRPRELVILSQAGQSMTEMIDSGDGEERHCGRRVVGGVSERVCGRLATRVKMVF